jgi:hypothetical protein
MKQQQDSFSNSNNEDQGLDALFEGVQEEKEDQLNDVTSPEDEELVLRVRIPHQKPGCAEGLEYEERRFGVTPKCTIKMDNDKRMTTKFILSYHGRQFTGLGICMFLPPSMRKELPNLPRPRMCYDGTTRTTTPYWWTSSIAKKNVEPRINYPITYENLRVGIAHQFICIYQDTFCVPLILCDPNSLNVFEVLNLDQQERLFRVAYGSEAGYFYDCLIATSMIKVTELA